MSAVRVKICGITNEADALVAVKAGADAIGMIFAESRRRVTIEQARRIVDEVPPWIVKVGVFVNASYADIDEVRQRVGLQIVQLHGDEDEAFCDMLWPNCIKVLRPRTLGDLQQIGKWRVGAWLLDTWSASERGGTGETFDWSLAQEAAKRDHRMVLSGGLNPENVADAIRLVRPAMVDVASGVEAAVGHKDPLKVQQFVERAKTALTQP